MRNIASLERIRERFPWPENKPSFDPVDWNLDGGGRELVEEIIVKRNVSIVLEIGTFLGGSVKTWLNSSPNVIVLALDGWPDNWAGDYARSSGKDERVVRQLHRVDGFYQTFLSTMWDYRHRIIPIRLSAPQGLYEVHALGAKPELIYLDASKDGFEIEICHKLFPGCVITGDDWQWENEHGYPIREPVRQYCNKHRKYLKVEKSTWAIDSDPPSLKQRFRSLKQRVYVARRRMRELVVKRRAA